MKEGCWGGNFDQDGEYDPGCWLRDEEVKVELELSFVQDSRLAGMASLKSIDELHAS